MGLLSGDDEDFGNMVREDANFRYWSNETTLSYERQMREFDPDGIAPVETFRVYLIESKINGARGYVAFDKKGEAFMDWNDPYTFDFKMSMYRMDLREDYDLINMAKKRGKKKGRKKR